MPSRTARASWVLRRPSRARRHLLPGRARGAALAEPSLSLVALLKQIVAEAGQIVMATHSPILLAFPGATILSFDESPIRSVRYDDLEHVTLSRAFLADPGAYRRHL